MKIFDELKRRNVFRVGIAYLVGAWVVTQVADIVLQIMGAPDILLRYLAIILALGFIPTVIISWVYEVTPEGVVKASEIDPDRSITHQTGKKLDMVTIALLVLAIGIVAVERFMPREGAVDPAADAVTAAPAEESPQAATEPTNPTTWPDSHFPNFGDGIPGFTQEYERHRRRTECGYHSRGWRSESG
jgi:hypothetical protein